MNAIVPKTRIALDARLLSQDVVVLVFQMANNLGEATSSVSIASCRRNGPLPGFIVNLIAKTRCVHDSERYAGTLLIKLQLWS